jgi:ABC-2 type transport system ATP-binding protein
VEECIVSVSNLRVIFGNFYAVRDVSFSVRNGEIFGFLGANGAGKTTTIRVLCGLLTPTSGEVIIDSERCVPGKEQLIKSKVGYMSQKFTLYDDLTIDENLSFVASLRKITKDTYTKRKRDLFDFIGFDRNPNIVVAELPVGLKQEIALVASLIHNPTIVFLDEPTAGVAPVVRARFWELIKQLASFGKAIFVTTHYMDEAENCDRVALMRSGELIALDSTQNLKKLAYDQQIYHITATNQENLDFLIRNHCDYFSMFEPYGRHFHAIVKRSIDEEKTINEMSRYCTIKKIDPSLEDVFVKLVEATSR